MRNSDKKSLLWRTLFNRSTLKISPTLQLFFPKFLTNFQTFCRRNFFSQISHQLPNFLPSQLFLLEFLLEFLNRFWNVSPIRRVPKLLITFLKQSCGCNFSANFLLKISHRPKAGSKSSPNFFLELLSWLLKFLAVLTFSPKLRLNFLTFPKTSLHSNFFSPRRGKVKFLSRLVALNNIFLLP